MASQSQPTFTITHLTTATTILNIDGINFLTDPYFGAEEGTAYDETERWNNADISKLGLTSVPPPPHLVNHKGSSVRLHDLPPIDAVLLSHEDHIDNLDSEGRKLLDGRRIFTTMDGAKNLAPRSGVIGLRPWQTVTSVIGGTEFRITGTPYKHFPRGEVTGFILETDAFGTNVQSGKPNAIYYSGDTVYIDELREIGKRWHITASLFNLGNATFTFPIGTIQITMDGKQAVRLMRDIDTEVMVPIHFESWDHFKEDRQGLEKVFTEEGVIEKIRWTEPGCPRRIF